MPAAALRLSLVLLCCLATAAPAKEVDYLSFTTEDEANTIEIFQKALRKSLKWYKKLFFHIINMAVLNSYYLYLVKRGKSHHI